MERRRLAASTGLLLAILTAGLVVLGGDTRCEKAELESSGSSLLAEALREVNSDKKLALQGGESRSELAKRKETSEAKHDELMDCEPFCGPSQGAGLAHNVVQALSLTTIRKAPKLNHGETADDKERREAKEEEKTHCQPFCQGDNEEHEVIKAEDNTILPHVKKSKVSESTHRALTPEDRAKIQEAAQKIAGVLSESTGVSADMKREMAHIKKLGTGWGALWGSSGSSHNLAQFDYLAAGPTSESHSSDPLGGGFHY